MKLTFFGGVEGVTGSCYLLTLLDESGKEHRLLVDCGMFQGERFAEETNKKAFGFDPKTIDVVLVTHPHADHTGRLAKLIQDGYTGRFVMTSPCAALTTIVLEDGYHIMKENAERLGEDVLYDEEDVKRVAAFSDGVGYHEAVEIFPGVTAMFHDAGHVLGSAFISIEAEGKRIVFSGDIGNDDVPILPDTEAISSADVVVCETTYGNRVHEAMGERRAKLQMALERVLRRKGMLLIPAFSIERTQELLFELNQMLLHDVQSTVPIFLDSPMAIRATAVYRHFKNYLKFDGNVLADPDRDFFSFPNLRETLTRDASQLINDVPNPKVVIAGSGMMSGGRVMHHLLRALPDENSTVLIIGYQASGTLGRKIYEGAKHVRVFGKAVEVKAHVEAIGAFSAHGDQQKLLRWLHPEEGGSPQKIFLVHGDTEAKQDFSHIVSESLGSSVVIPHLGETYEF